MNFLLIAVVVTQCERHELALEWRKAHHCWEKIAKNNAAMAPTARYRKGLCLLRRNKYRRSRRAFRWVIQNHRDPASFEVSHARMLLLEKEWVKATRKRERKYALRLIPKYRGLMDMSHPGVRRDVILRIAELWRIAGEPRRARQLLDFDRGPSSPHPQEDEDTGRERALERLDRPHGP